MAFDFIDLDPTTFALDATAETLVFEGVETGGETRPLDGAPALDLPDVDLVGGVFDHPDLAEVEAFIEASEALGEGLKALEARLLEVARGAIRGAALATDPAQDMVLMQLHAVAMQGFATVQAINLGLAAQEIVGEATAATGFQFVGSQPPEHEIDLARARIAAANDALNAAGPAVALATAARGAAWQGVAGFGLPAHFLSEAFSDLFGLQTAAATRMAQAMV